MSITMFIELECGASLSCVTHVLSTLAISVEQGESSIEGTFPVSRGFFYFEKVFPARAIVSEGYEGGWLVGLMGAFHCPVHELEQNWNEIKCFMETLARQCKARFVLSFQYESVFAYNDGGAMIYENSMVLE